MTQTISQRIRNANVLMTLLVVGLHTVGDEPALRCVRPVTDMAVPVFFAISAYLYFQRWEPGWRCYAGKLVSRLRSLYVPFVVFNALFIPYRFLKIHVLHLADSREVSVGVADMLGSIFLGVPTVPDGPLWYVQALLLFALFAPLLGYAMKFLKHALLPMLALGLWLTYKSSYFSVLHWTPCLLLGCWCAFNEERLLGWLERLRRSALRHLVAPFFVVFVAATCVLMSESFFQSMAYDCYRMTMPCWVLLLYALRGNLLPERMVGLLYPYTFFIYCTHTLFIYASHHFLQMLVSGMNMAVEYLATYVVATVAVVLFSMAMGKTGPLWRVVNGFRQRR